MHSHSGTSLRQRQAQLDLRPLDGKCEECGKLRYPSRRGAKAARRRTKLRSDGHQLTIYRCGDYWHIGHTPHQIRMGYQARATFASESA